MRDDVLILEHGTLHFAVWIKGLMHFGMLVQPVIERGADRVPLLRSVLAVRTIELTKNRCQRVVSDRYSGRVLQSLALVAHRLRSIWRFVAQLPYRHTKRLC